MAVAPARLKAANEVDVTTLALPENDLAVVTEVLGTTVVKLDELARLTRDPRYVDQLVNDPKLASEARKIFFAIHRSVLGQHVGNGNAPQNKDGAAGPDVVNIFARRYAEVPKGETSPQKQLREDLPLALIGQENKLDRFVDLLKDYESGARLTPPLMALTGDPAHGKDQAIKGFAQSVLGPEAEVIAINCADLDVTKGHFDKDNILGPERLKKIADGKPAAVIRLQNPEVLAQKPREAAALAELLSAEKETPKYARVIYFLDFETLKGDDVSQRMVCALGATKNELLSCSAEFQHLDGPAMAKYARLLEKKILRQAGLDGIVVDYDPRALEFLGEMLATPHRPLDVLSQRLLRFAFDQFDTQTSVRRKGAKMNVTLAPPYDEELAIERTETLKAVRAEKVDLRKHGDVFFAQEVGIVGVEAPDVTAARTLADQLVPALEAQAMRLATLVPARAAGIDASVGALGQRVLDFANDLASVLARAEHSVRIALADIADASTVERLVLAIEGAISDSQALRAALDKQGKPLQAALSRLEAQLTQAHTLVDGLAAEHARVNPAE